MPTPQPIHVLCAANSTYAMPLAVMLTSLVCHYQSSRSLHLHIVASDISDSLRQKIEASVLNNKKGAYHLEFHWTSFDPSHLKNLPVGGEANQHITSEAYSRLLVADALPPSCERVIYLDCDLVVLKDIALLHDAADNEHTIAVVAGVTLSYVSSLYGATPAVFNYAELGIPATNRYFNSGVMVINLKPWREQNIAARVIDYLERYHDKVLYHDQGGLNAILYDQWLRLDQRWNHTGCLNPASWKEPAFTREEYLKVRFDPFIAHYLGGDKPWMPGFNRPRAAFFFCYLRKTLFKDEVKMSRGAYLEFMIGYRNYFFLWTFIRWLRDRLGR